MHHLRASVFICWLIATFMPALPFAQKTDFDEQTLKVKNMFARQTLQAMAEPFVGITTNGEPTSGLYPIRKSGVATTSIVAAAEDFLAELRTEQKVRTVFSVEALEWRRWSNVDVGIFSRQGLSLKEMTQPQRKAAEKLMRESLSAKGLKLSFDIMKTDRTLSEINDDILSFDEALYYIKIMGLPSSSEPWGWQLNGHHLAINYFVLGDQVVLSPVFVGGEPVNIVDGKYSGTQILQQEQNLGLAMMRSLNSSQQSAAILSTPKRRNFNQAEANQDNLVLNYQGVSAAKFSDDQKSRLLELIGLFINNMRDGHARIRMEEVATYLDNTWFAWAGDVSDDAVFYFRVHSPVILIEFDHQLPVGTRKLHAQRKPIRDHIHVVVRTPNGNDYGKDLLQQHLEEHAH